VLIANNPHLVESFGKQPATMAGVRSPADLGASVQPVVSVSPRPEDAKPATKFDVPIEPAAPNRKENTRGQFEVPLELPTPGTAAPTSESTTTVKPPVANTPGSSPKASSEPAKKPPAFDVAIELAPPQASTRSEKTFASYTPSVAAPAVEPTPIIQAKAVSSGAFASGTPAAMPVQHSPRTENVFANGPEVPNPAQAAVPGDPFDPADFNRTMHPQR
jgi:hypothetical protein